MASKFTALADFMREASLFNALAALPFMSTFYLAKAHARLFSSVRRSGSMIRALGQLGWTADAVSQVPMKRACRLCRC
jgi:hypothetical protein